MRIPNQRDSCLKSRMCISKPTTPHFNGSFNGNPERESLPLRPLWTKKVDIGSNTWNLERYIRSPVQVVSQPELWDHGSWESKDLAGVQGPRSNQNYEWYFLILKGIFREESWLLFAFKWSLTPPPPHPVSRKLIKDQSHQLPQLLEFFWNLTN